MTIPEKYAFACARNVPLYVNRFSVLFSSQDKKSYQKSSNESQCIFALSPPLNLSTARIQNSSIWQLAISEIGLPKKIVTFYNPNVFYVDYHLKIDGIDTADRILFENEYCSNASQFLTYFPKLLQNRYPKIASMTAQPLQFSHTGGGGMVNRLSAICKIAKIGDSSNVKFSPELAKTLGFSARDIFIGSPGLGNDYHAGADFDPRSGRRNIYVKCDHTTSKFTSGNSSLGFDDCTLLQVLNFYDPEKGSMDGAKGKLLLNYI
jgi:hypothetical protein